MKILFVLADAGVPVHGTKGASVHVRSLARAWERAGHDVLIAAAALGAPPSGGRDAFPVALLPSAPPAPNSPPAGEIARIRDGESAVDAVRDLVRRFRPDLVYERYSLWSRAGVEGAIAGRIACVLEVNAPLVEETVRYRSLDDVARARAIARDVFSRAQVVCAVSTPLAAYVRAEGGAAERVHVVPNAVDADLFADPPPRADGPFTLGFCGSLRPWHGVDDLARIFLEVRGSAPETRLLVIGDGPERERLAARLDALGAGAHARFTGAVDHASVPAWLARIDVGLAPYPPLEPFYFSPLKILEYQAAGRAVVASRLGDVADMVEHDVTGLLHTAGDAGDATRCVLALAADPVRRARLGDAARRGVLERHTWDRRALEILQLAGSAPVEAAT